MQSFLARGAAVIGLDVNAAIESQAKRADYLGIACDVTDAAQLTGAIERGVGAFGGLDMVVLNAGIFPGGTRIESLADSEWDRVMRVNLDANLALLRESHPLLKLAPRGGRVVVIGSKNVPAPGPGAAAYSASKAALTQLARVAALEWGADGIRINTLHPNAVFDTGHLDRRSARAARQTLRALGGGLQEEQRPRRGGDEPRRGGARRRTLRSALRQDHRRPGAGGWGKRSRHLAAATRTRARGGKIAR